MADFSNSPGELNDTASTKELEMHKQTPLTSSMESQTNEKDNDDNSSSEEAEKLSYHNSPSSPTFAQTRSPPPVVDADQLQSRTSSSGYDGRDVTRSLKSGVSPFMQDFLSADTKSSFFSTRRVTAILKLRTPSQDNYQCKRTSTSQSNTSDSHTAINADSTGHACAESVPPTQKFTQAETMQVVRFRPANNDEGSATEASQVDAIAEGILTPNAADSDIEECFQSTVVDDSPQDSEILGGAQDRQTTGVKQVTTQAVSAKNPVFLSRSAPFIPPFEEPASPQTSWGIHTLQEFDKKRLSAFEVDGFPIHPLSSELERSPSPEELAEGIPADTAREDEMIGDEIEIAVVTTSDKDWSEVERIVTREDDLPDATSPQQIDCEQFQSSIPPEAPGTPVPATGEPQNLLHSPPGPEALSAQPESHSRVPLEPACLVSYPWPPEHRVHNNAATEDTPWSTTSDKSPSNSSVNPVTDVVTSTGSESPTAILSSPSDVSDTGLGMRIGTTSDDNEVFLKEEAGARLSQFRTLLNQELHDFKADFLQQLNTTLCETTNKWNATRNSIVATIIARPSMNEALNLLENSIKAEISDKQHQVCSRLDRLNVESFDCSTTVARVTKEYFGELVEDMKNAIIQHIDQRFDERKKQKGSSLSTTPDKSTEKTVHFEISDAEQGMGDGPTIAQNISTTTDQMKSLIITTTNDISAKLDRSNDHAKTEQNQNIAIVGAMQRDIIEHLRQIMYHSTLQNHAINELSTTITPLHTVVKSLSHDATLIDAKLAKNAEVLTAVTEQAEKLEKTASSFDKIVNDASVASKFENAALVEKLMAKVTKIAAASNNATDITAKVEALQDQVSGMQQQMSQVLELLNTRESAMASIPDTRGHLTLRTNIDRRASESGYISATDSNTSERLTDSSELPTISTHTIFKFEFQKRKALELHYPAHLKLSDLDSVKRLVQKTRSVWTKYLAKQGVSSVEIDLISIWLPATAIAVRRLVDNDTAYNGWFKAASTGHIAENRPLLEIEFLVCDKTSGEVSQEPRSKKRKQEEISKSSESDVEFRFGVWKAGRPMKYI